MVLTTLVLASAVLAQVDCGSSISNISQLYEYQVGITKTKGGVTLQANPEKEGGATAWFCVEQGTVITREDTLVIKAVVTANRLRVKYLFYRKNTQAYWGGIKIIGSGAKEQTIKIPLAASSAFYNGNYPFSLTPGRTPELFLFFDNLLPGRFNAVISSVTVLGSAHRGTP
jgi:hypothetical protein